MGIIKTGRIQTMGDPIGDLYVKAIWFEQIDSGTSGTLALPAQGEVVLDQWAAGIDALASTLSSGIPAFVSPTTAGGVIVTATLDGNGAWTLSGTPSAYPVAIIYVYKVKFRYFDSTKQLGGYELIPSADGVFTDVTNFNSILSSADNEVQKALDTLDNHTHGGTSNFSKSFIITNPTSESDSPIWRTPEIITITAVHVLCVGGTSIIGMLDEYDNNGANPVPVDNSDITGLAGVNVNDDGTLNNPSISAGNYVGWHTTSVSGSVSKCIVTFDYTV